LKNIDESLGIFLVGVQLIDGSSTQIIRATGRDERLQFSLTIGRSASVTA